MINIFEVNETNKMIEQENLDVRTITMGISLLDCIDSDLDTMNEKIYNKITTKAKDLVATGDKIAAEFGIPVVNNEFLSHQLHWLVELHAILQKILCLLQRLWIRQQRLLV